jgi:uncharacterized protein YerC
MQHADNRRSTRRNIRLQTRQAERLLKSPLMVSQRPLVRITRDALIRQVWHGGRVLAMIRNGESYANELGRLETSIAMVAKAMRCLRFANKLGECNGK